MISKFIGGITLVLTSMTVVFSGPGYVLASDTGPHRMDEITVTATTLETPIEEVGSSTTIITSKQIEEAQWSTVLETLRSVEGLGVVETSGPGSTASVFIRGANSEHTLVLIDGVVVNDPISPGHSFDFANLTTDNVERIEIIRGPQSTLYGSDAMGGVINIITKKGKGKPAGFFSTEAGSYGTFIEKGEVSGGNTIVNYSIGASRTDSRGISAADRRYGNHEKDGYGNTSFSGRFGLVPVKNFSLDLVARYADTRADLDNNGGPGGDDPNYVLRSQNLTTRLQGELALFDGFWTQKLGLSLARTDRDYRNSSDIDHPFDAEVSSFHGETRKIDWQHHLFLHETNTLTFGAETTEEQGKSDYLSQSAWGLYASVFDKETARTTGCYIQDEVRVGRAFFATAGVRLDDHSKFGTKTTYRLAASYLILQTGTRFKATYGTGFKAPSLYQLYSQYGDPNLKPEESTGWDVGFEQSLIDKRLSFGATYFHNAFDNMILFDSATSTYENVGKAVTEGVEMSLSFEATKKISFRGSYTYLDTEDKSTGAALLRRPKNKLSLEGNYRVCEKCSVNAGIVYVGKRDDNYYSSMTYTTTRVSLGGYTLVNLAASYDITKNVRIFGRVDNLFNKYYEEVAGWGTMGFSVYGGVKLLF